MSRYDRSQQERSRRSHAGVTLNPSYRFRVVASRSRRAPEVLWLTNDRTYAVELAERIELLSAEQSVARKIWVESWNGARKMWQRLRGAPDVALPERSRLVSGDIVEGVLEPKRPNRDCWKAAIPASLHDTAAGSPAINNDESRETRGVLIGPITNSSMMPISCLPGDCVRLKIEAINADGSHLQFRWLGEAQR